MIFVPYVLAEVIAGIAWKLLLQPNGGVNAVLDVFGLGFLKQNWLADPTIALWTIFLILTWKYVGFAILLMLAGLQGVPEELAEAAQIDGASWWQVQRYITLPLLGPTIRIWAFLSIIGSLQVFDMIWVTVSPAIRRISTESMATYMVQQGQFAGQPGYGSAIAVILFLISLVIALVYQRFALRRDLQGAITRGVR
jgi:raffinose/stachyose/melibiose transport system permease protein